MAPTDLVEKLSAENDPLKKSAQKTTQNELITITIRQQQQIEAQQQLISQQQQALDELKKCLEKLEQHS